MNMMMLQPNIGDEPLSGGGLVPMALPQAKLGRGMFGNGGLRDALMAAAAGFLSRRSPQVSNTLFDAIQRKQILADQEAQYQRHRQDELTDYGQKLQLQAQYKAPDYGEFERELIASGVTPGSPEWVKAMATRVGNTLDPIVITPQGPMLRSTVMGALQPQVLQTLPPGAKPIGGPTPQASGGFSGY